MARGWHYTKLSLSNALLLSFLISGICALCYCSFLSVGFFVLFLFLLSCSSRCSVVADVPLSDLFLSPEDHVVPDWQPRSVLLGMVEARSINIL